MWLKFFCSVIRYLQLRWNSTTKMVKRLQQKVSRHNGQWSKVYWKRYRKKKIKYALFK